jgi:hypothetical protein
MVESILCVIGGTWVVLKLAGIADEHFASKRLEKQRARYRELVKLHGEPSPDSDFWAMYSRPTDSL